MKQVWKPVLFVSLNLLFILVLLGLISLHFQVYNHSIEDPIALLAVIPADGVFVLIGILLMLLSKFYHIPVLNQVLPFMAIAGFTLTFILGTTLAGPADTWEPAYLIAIAIGAVLFVLALGTMVRNLAS